MSGWWWLDTRRMYGSNGLPVCGSLHHSFHSAGKLHPCPTTPSTAATGLPFQPLPVSQKVRHPLQWVPRGKSWRATGVHWLTYLWCYTSIDSSRQRLQTIGKLFYASPLSGDAYSDRQLTLILNFELDFFVCRHVSIWRFRNRVCLFIRTPRKGITLASSISVLH